ncbi:MAG: sodium/calcium exchanger protein, partial [Acidimicrobiia bacterium]
MIGQRELHPNRQRISMLLALLVALPGVVLRFARPELPHPAEAIIFGLAIVGAAFLLSWAAEAAQLDVSAGLALALLALIAVLPEYAVDLVFAWKGGEAVRQFGPACGPPEVIYDERACSLALANMTGANRLLIGLGWSLVVFLAWYRVRSLRRARGTERLPAHLEAALAEESGREVRLERSHSVEVAYLALATIYSLTLPLKSSLTLLDAVVLVGIFVLYVVRLSKAPPEEPHLVGPARYVGSFPVTRRRTMVVGMFVWSAAVILACAEPFAEALVETGGAIGISSFVLVQWLAPLASEAPELLVAGLYAWRLNTSAGLGTLVSSKVNQWTLLVGTLPIVFSVATGGPNGLPLGDLQREELFLTAAQSFFAVAVLSNLSLSTMEALGLFSLFWFQFILGALVPESMAAAER